MTSCPCTLEYSTLKTKNEILQFITPKQTSLLQRIPPTFTHSQPGKISVSVFSTHNLPTYKKLFHCIESVSHICSSVLKRPDEHFFIEKSHRKPQFCEDLCREIASMIAAELEADDVVEVEALVDESIHPHKVFAHIKTKAENLWNC